MFGIFFASGKIISFIIDYLQHFILFDTQVVEINILINTCTP